MVAYVGNDPNRAESGDIEGYHLSISKKGNKRLRCILYLAVTCSIRSRKENPINAFYQKKRQQSTPLKSKAGQGSLYHQANSHNPWDVQDGYCVHQLTTYIISQITKS